VAHGWSDQVWWRGEHKDFNRLLSTLVVPNTQLIGAAPTLRAHEPGLRCGRAACPWIKGGTKRVRQQTVL